MSIKLKKKYDYIKTQVGQIIPISSIISIEKDNTPGSPTRMFDTYKIYYNKQTLYKPSDFHYGLNKTDFKLKYDFIELNYEQYQDFLKHFKNKIYNI